MVPDKKNNYVHFIVRRICRIYIPFFVVLAVTTVLFWLIYKPNEDVLISWNTWEGNALSIQNVLGHFLMYGTADTKFLNPPLWTLVIEMRIAFIFPLLVWLVKKLDVFAVFIAVVTSYLASKLYVMYGQGDEFYAAANKEGAVLLTIYYIQFFVIGIYMASKRTFIVRSVRMIPVYIHVVALAVLFCVPQHFLVSHFVIGDLRHAALASYVIICCFSFPSVDRVLNFPVLQWVGHNSYSLYLAHVPVVIVLSYILGNVFPIYVAVFASIFFVFAIAALIHHYVEKPSITIGYILTGRRTVSVSSN